MLRGGLDRAEVWRRALVPLVVGLVFCVTGTLLLSHASANTVDTTAPTFVSVDLSPTALHFDRVGDSASITVTAHVTDDVSGVSRVEFHFVNAPDVSATLVSGTSLDG